MSMSKPIHEIPNRRDANAVEPIPMNGSKTTLHFVPDSLIWYKPSVTTIS